MPFPILESKSIFTKTLCTPLKRKKNEDTHIMEFKLLVVLMTIWYVYDHLIYFMGIFGLLFSASVLSTKKNLATLIIKWSLVLSDLKRNMYVQELKVSLEIGILIEDLFCLVPVLGAV
jgi:hypothetical protein